MHAKKPPQFSGGFFNECYDWAGNRVSKVVFARELVTEISPP